MLFLGKFINTGQHFSRQMVRERKTRIKDIQKLHELIDSASLPKQKTFTPSDNERLEKLRKQLSEDGEEDRRVVPSEVISASSARLTPRVVVHKKEEIQKKEERVIQINLSQRSVKTEKEPEQKLVNFIHVKEDMFCKEPLFEIEKITIPPQEFIEIKPTDTVETPLPENEFIPVLSIREEKTHSPPESEMKKQKNISVKPSEKSSATKKEYFTTPVQQKEPHKESSAVFTQEPQQNIPSFEPVEFTESVAEKIEPKPLIGTITTEKDRKQQKIEKKQAKRLLKEKTKKEKIQELQTKEQLREEHTRKEMDFQQAIAQAEEKEREEERLLQEQKEKERLEKLDVLDKQRKQKKRKKIEEKKAKLELKEKKREAKRLAKEHDQKLKLEWVEFQHTQKQSQKTKLLEEKKAAAIAKEKEREEQRLLKEKDEKLRLEQLTLLKKEKEESKQKKIEEKKARQEAKQKELEERRLAQEREKKQKIEQLQIKQKQQEEEKQKELEQKKAAILEAEKQQQEQRLLKEQKKKSLIKEPEKKQEEPIVIKQKKEKKTPAFSFLARRKEKTQHEPKTQQPEQKEPDVSWMKSVTAKKQEPNEATWESYDEKTAEETKEQLSGLSKEESSPDTQKLLLKKQKEEQKRQHQEQKEKERQEKLELKKELKEQKIQKKLEQKQRSALLSEQMEDKQRTNQRKIEEKRTKQEAKEKEKEAKRLLKLEEKNKEKAFALKELQIKQKEKEEEKQKEAEDKKDKLGISKLGIGKAKGTEVIDERKKAEQQKSTMELVRIAAEEKELRKTRVFERKMEKERKKKEKEEQRFKVKENEKAKRNMNLQMKEQLIKEKLAKQPDRDDPFIAFDSIDKETAMILNSVGYTSVEKLRQASVKDLVKIGLKKKNAQRIIAECEEFVEWEVFDAADHF